jgi:hypothetical protein
MLHTHSTTLTVATLTHVVTSFGVVVVHAATAVAL